MLFSYFNLCFSTWVESPPPPEKVLPENYTFSCNRNINLKSNSLLYLPFTWIKLTNIWVLFSDFILVSYFSFVVCSFRLVPFLTELRAVMDWVWTDTSLSLSSWICVEDIYAHIFILKCWRESEKVFIILQHASRRQIRFRAGLSSWISRWNVLLFSNWRLNSGLDWLASHFLNCF